MAKAGERGEQRQPTAPPTSWTGSGRIEPGIDVAGVLAAVNAASIHRDCTMNLAHAVERAGDVGQTPDVARIMPVIPELTGLLPWPGGLRRGATVATVGCTSMIFALLTEAMANGAWAAIVGLPNLSPLGAATDYGIDPARLALIPNPGEQWATVVAALVDGLDAVVVATPADVPAGTARALMGRAQQRGCVLIPTGRWPGCDLTLELVGRRWRGLGQGRGRLRLQEVTISAAGKGRAARPRQVTTTLPPPSVTQRIGPQQGGIPGLLHEHLLDSAPAIVPLSPIQSPKPAATRPADPWSDLLTRLTSRRRGNRTSSPPG